MQNSPLGRVWGGLEQASCQTKWLLSVDVEDGGDRNSGDGSFGVDALRFSLVTFFLFLPSGKITGGGGVGGDKCLTQRSRDLRWNS